MAETARFNPKTYFETDPYKLGAASGLSGVLALPKAAINSIANVGVRGYNAVGKAFTPTTTFAERNAAFPAANVRRYQPQGVAPVTPVAAPPARPDFPAHLERDILARDRASAPATPQAPRPSARRAVVAPAGRPVPMTTPTVTFSTETPEAQAPERGYIESGGTRYYIPGSQAYDGVGATGPAQFEAAPSFRKRAGDVGYTGTQEEWEDDQVAAKINSRPFGFKMAAAQLALRQQGETEENNLRTNAVSQQNADTLTGHYRTTDRRTTALLPGEVATQGAALRKSALDAKNQELVNEFYPEATQADIDAKKGLTGYYRQMGTAAEAKVGTDLTLEKQALVNEQRQRELEAKNNSPIVKADAALAEAVAPSVGLLASEVSTAMRAGYRTPQKEKKPRLFGLLRGQKAGMVNAQGEVYDPTAPAGYTPTGTFTPEGKPIYKDAQGKKFVQ